MINICWYCKLSYFCTPKFLAKNIENYLTMYAIVDIAGQQFKVEKDSKIYVNRLSQEEGSKVTFDKVLFVDNGKAPKIGTPVVSGASVSAKVLTHVKGDKVLIFKKKRRKGYQKLNGFRHSYTQIQIEDIKA